MKNRGKNEKERKQWHSHFKAGTLKKAVWN
jgi:hypothetical protein